MKLVTECQLTSGRKHENYPHLVREWQRFPSLANAALVYGRPVNALAFLDNLAARGTEPKTYNGYRDTLSAVVNYLLKLETVSRNPGRGVDWRKVVVRDESQPYTDAQRQTVRNEVVQRGDAQMKFFTSFVYYCFVRINSEPSYGCCAWAELLSSLGIAHHVRLMRPLWGIAPSPKRRGGTSFNSSF